jgi:VCBS repeat-containing protein
MINQQYLQFVQGQLAQFAAQDNFESIIFTAFGDRVDLLLLQDLRQQWLAGDFSVIPEIQVVENGELGGAKGAYAAELDRIFVATDFLATASASSIGAVLLEEVGHRIDRLLNRELDSVGDEGELFSALVRGVSLTAAQIAVIKAEDDHTTAVINGQIVEIETARFSSPSTFAVGAPTSAVAVGDFNGDGKQDIVTASNNSPYEVSVLIGNGIGGFANSATFGTTGYSPSLVVGDFNGDGNQDIATIDQQANSVVTLIGNGNGSSSNSRYSNTGQGAHSIVVGDFNGDGKQDLATTNSDYGGPGSISVLVGDGSGSFTTSNTLDLMGASPLSIVVGDFNGDGKQDLATTNSVLIGNGSGGFINSAILDLAINVTGSMAVGDFNGDGKQDIVAGVGSGVSVLIGNGNGGFINSATFTTGGSFGSIVVGDFNSDGKQDLAIGKGYNGGLSVLLGNGSGEFTSLMSLNVGPNNSVAVGDFNNDGKQDIVTSSWDISGSGDPGSVSVLLNTSPIITISPGITPQEQGSNGIVPFNPPIPSQLPPSDGSFTINLDTPAPSGGLVVNFTLAGGTATFGTDYTLAPGVGVTAVTNNSFSIAGGFTTATLIVSPINDGIPDPNETIQITLQSGDDYILGALPQAVLSILDSTGNIENHAPTLDFVVPINYTDTTLNDVFTPTTGVLIGFDPDANTTLVYGLAGGTVTGTTSNVTGAYGTISLNNLTGAYTYTPNATAINAASANANLTDDFTFTVSDGSLSAQQPFAVNIFGSNDNPTSAATIANQSAAEEAPFSFTIPAGVFTDIDANDFLTFSATLSNNLPLPAWLEFDASTGTFSGIPINSDVGAINVKVTATDLSGAFVSSEFNLVVTNTNNAPTLVNAINDLAIAEDAPFSFTIPLNTFADIDVDSTLNLFATLSDGSGLPEWLTFNSNTRTFSGIPTNGEVGTISVRVTATDASNTFASDEFDLVINNINDAPTIGTAIVDQSTAENAPFSFTIPLEAFADVDANDTLTLSASLANGLALPSWLTFNTSTGTFSGTPTSSDVRTIAVKVTATDASNTFVSDEFNLTVVDATPPPAPLITGISNDTGVSNTDRITSDTTLILAGTAEANSTVQIFRSNVAIGTATTNASGNWSFDYTNTTLGDSTYNFTATATDAAGNSSVRSASFLVTVDTTAPTKTATITSLSPDPGTSSTDFLTNDGTTVRTYSGALSAALSGDESLQISVDGGITWSNATANGTTWTFMDNSTQTGNWTIQARVSDLAGNFGVIASKIVTLDRQISAASAVTLDLIATSDTGVSNTDNITRIQTPTFAITFDTTKSQVGDILEVRSGSAVLGIATLTAAQVSAGAANITLNAALSNGINTLSAVHRDKAGNSSTSANTLNVTFDQRISAASAVTLDLLATSDSGVSQIDNITNVTAPTFTLTFDTTRAKAGDILEVRRGSVVLGAATLNANQANNTGTVNLTLATALTNGSNILSAVHRDLAGNTATSATLTVVSDVTAPVAPNVFGYSATSVTGTTEANTTILFSTSASSPTSFATTTTANNSNNYYIANISSLAGSNAGQTYYTYARDVAGNLSLASSSRVVVAAAGNNTLSNVGSTSSDLVVGNVGTLQTVEYAVSGNAISLTGQITTTNVANGVFSIKNANIDVLSSIEKLNFTGTGYSSIAVSTPGLNQLRGQIQVNPAALVNNSISAFTGAYDAALGTFSIGSGTPNATLVAFDTNSGSGQNYEAFLVLDKTSISGGIGFNQGVVNLII